VLIGPNNSGKSSIAEALTYASVHHRAVLYANFHQPATEGFGEFYTRHFRQERCIELTFSPVKGTTTDDPFTVTFEPDGQGMLRHVRYSPKPTNAGPLERVWKSFLDSVRYYGPFEQLGRPAKLEDDLELDRFGL